MVELPEPLQFNWDLGNQTKILSKHGISVTDCEEAFTVNNVLIFHDEKHSVYEDRYVLISEGNSVPLFIVFTIRNSFIRIISARRMHKKELIAYEKKAQNSKI